MDASGSASKLRNKLILPKKSGAAVFHIKYNLQSDFSKEYKVVSQLLIVCDTMRTILKVSLFVGLSIFTALSVAENPGDTTTEVSNATETVDEEAELHEFDAVTVIVLCGSLFSALAAGYGLHKYKFNYLPHSTAAMLIGVAVGGIASAVQTENATLSELEVLSFSSEFFFYVLLPPIIFDAGYHFEKKRFFRNFSTILLFAILGTIISTFIIGGVVFGFASAGVIKNIDNNDPLEALLFGSLISAVDPVATLSIMGNPELKYVVLICTVIIVFHLSTATTLNYVHD